MCWCASCHPPPRLAARRVPVAHQALGLQQPKATSVRDHLHAGGDDDPLGDGPRGGHEALRGVPLHTPASVCSLVCRRL